MKVSISWLKEYTPVEMDISALAEALTMTGLEVVSVTDRFEYLKDIIVAKVLNVKQHPYAGNLNLCQVNIGETKIQVICGAPNVTKHMLVPLALPGTFMPTGKTLKKKKIRGEKSEGMICSAVELAIGENVDGIMVLDESCIVGEKLNKSLNLSDMVLEINLPPNRPDCLGIIGIAREVAAIQNSELSHPQLTQLEEHDNINNYTSVRIEAPDLCLRYTARLILDVKVAPSPFWLQDRLLSVGLTPINNVVDSTNYIMMEIGQPLHAFDFDRLEENKIVVKTAEKIEEFTTLDDKKHKLTTETLRICDGKKTVAIGGVMGGQNSEIKNTTTRVLLESACFKPQSIRKTSKKLNIQTNTSHRMERGVDPLGCLTAQNRGAYLITKLGKGKLIKGIIDEHPKPSVIEPISLSIRNTNRLLGFSLNKEKIAGYLNSIEFKTEIIDEEIIKVTAPSFRVDITQPEDLMEEVARLFGYNNIPVTYPLVLSQSKLLPKYLIVRHKIRNLLLGFGLTETINYSFNSETVTDKLYIQENDERKKTLKILNPLTEDQRIMRTSIIPGLLETAHRNIDRQTRNISIFEIGNIFISNGKKNLPTEIEILCGLITGSKTAIAWHTKDTACDFFDIKGIVESLFKGLAIKNINFSQLPDSMCFYMRKGHSAKITASNDLIGIVGKVDSNVLNNYDLKQDVFIFEFELKKLMKLIPDKLELQRLPKFPSMNRDITIIIDKTIQSKDILAILNNKDEEIVEKLQIVDVYEGDSIPEDKKSISFRITYRSATKTLKDKQVNNLHNKLSRILIKKFNASLPT